MPFSSIHFCMIGTISFAIRALLPTYLIGLTAPLSRNAILLFSQFPCFVLTLSCKSLCVYDSAFSICLTLCLLTSLFSVVVFTKLFFFLTSFRLINYPPLCFSCKEISITKVFLCYSISETCVLIGIITLSSFDLCSCTISPLYNCRSCLFVIVIITNLRICKRLCKVSEIKLFIIIKVLTGLVISVILYFIIVQLVLKILVIITILTDIVTTTVTAITRTLVICEQFKVFFSCSSYNWYIIFDKGFNSIGITVVNTIYNLVFPPKNSTLGIHSLYNYLVTKLKLIHFLLPP